MRRSNLGNNNRAVSDVDAKSRVSDVDAKSSLFDRFAESASEFASLAVFFIAAKESRK